MSLMLCLLGPHAGQLIEVPDAAAAETDGWAKPAPEVPFATDDVRYNAPMSEWPKSLRMYLGESWYNVQFPELTSISPTSAEVGSADVTLVCTGSGFSELSTILFNGGPEPTTFVSETEISTIVKPSTAFGPLSVPVSVAQGPFQTDPQMFEFTEPPPVIPLRDR